MVSADVQLHAQCLKHTLCYRSSSHRQDTDPDGGDGVELGVILLPKAQSSNAKKSVRVSRVSFYSTPSTHAIPEQHNYQAWQEVWQEQREEQVQQGQHLSGGEVACKACRSVVLVQCFLVSQSCSS